MDGLRWILLIAGAIIVAGVFLYSRRKAGDADGRPADNELAGDSVPTRVPPSLGMPADEVEEPDADAQPREAPEPARAMGDQIDIVDSLGDESDEIAEPRPDVPQKIVTLRIVSGDKSPFNGDRLVLALRGIGMRHGRFGIFHQYDGDDERVVAGGGSAGDPCCRGRPGEGGRPRG